MTLVSVGNQNVILNSNPNKTFWKTTFQKYTNFGLQHFRLDYEGTPSLRLTEESTFTFKVKRYADLLLDTYIVVNLPNIWSTEFDGQEYDFKWIDHIGAQMIRTISVTCGNQTLQQFSGRYLLSCVQRDFSGNKLTLFNEMTGHVDELNNPAKYHGSYYPNAIYEPGGAQPSINGRTLYIPMNTWFNLKTQQAFPLVALQYNELQITITFRPINQLFQVRDVTTGLYIAPNFNKAEYQMHRFLQTPPEDGIYVDKRNVWAADIHLDCTYAFLSSEEQQVFASSEQKYLIRQVVETDFYNVQNKVDLESTGLVTNWLFYFQRSDVPLRNEWSNYSNWQYKQNPLVLLPTSDPTRKVTGPYDPASVKEILLELGIVIDGQYRENMAPVGVYNYIEKYTRTLGNAPNGLYCYNFALNSSPQELQPGGAMNMSRHQSIQFEFTTIQPPFDTSVQVTTICDPETGAVIGINKPNWRLYEYNYNLCVFEERINMVTFHSGNAGLMYSL